MLMTKRKPASVAEILVEEFMAPMGLTQVALADAMGVQRKHVNELCNQRRTVTAATALILARVFGNSPDFWLNIQRRSDLWSALHDPRERQRIERAKPLTPAAQSPTAARADVRRRDRVNFRAGNPYHFQT
jgi:addiction module HigA family antidote